MMGLMRFPPAISEYLQEASVCQYLYFCASKASRIMGLIHVPPAKSENLVKYLVKKVKEVKEVQKVVN